MEKLKHSETEHLQKEFEFLVNQLVAIRSDMVSLANSFEKFLTEIDPNYQKSAQNLLHYLTFRCRDLRALQVKLARLGLSSLGRAESHVLATVDAVVKTLCHAMGKPWHSPEPASIDFSVGRRLLEEHKEALLGRSPAEHHVHIMVTMPSEAADDYTLVHELVKSGMNCMRINCAHDDISAWSRMIEHLRRAERATQRSCRLLMDLAGPKLRTGMLEPGERVIKVRPVRDLLGCVVRPARVWLSSLPIASPTPSDASLPVSQYWLSKLKVGDKIEFQDVRGATRRLKILDVTKDGCWAETKKTAYIVPGTILSCRSIDGDQKGEVSVGGFLPHENPILLRQGDLLILSADVELGRPATLDSSGQVLSPATIGCTLPEIIKDLRAGERVWLDDGKIGGFIEKVKGGRAYIRISECKEKGGKLRGDKGINLPDSRLRLPALTNKDIKDLEFIVQQADMVALSFANSADDVKLLQQHLTSISSQLGSKSKPAIVLKIETKRGFENLPAMLLAAMAAPCCGVMIARGDLAVECGFERLAEVQEEILWLCEAAHVPVIWATQVLESLAKEGLPSRAEISDAAMGTRAECVMLNKGPHIIEAVKALSDILRRMQGHQSKKSSMLRQLNLAQTFLERQ